MYAFPTWHYVKIHTYTKKFNTGKYVIIIFMYICNAFFNKIFYSITFFIRINLTLIYKNLQRNQFPSCYHRGKFFYYLLTLLFRKRMGFKINKHSTARKYKTYILINILLNTLCIFYFLISYITTIGWFFYI